jgi:hypothetical protein
VQYEQWQLAMHDYLEGCRAELRQIKRPDRLATFDVLKAFNAILRCLLGKPITAWVVTMFDDEYKSDIITTIDLKAVDSFPVMSIALDQGSSGWAASWFLAFKMHVSICIMADPSHRANNDILNAVKQTECEDGSSLWSTVLLCQIPFGLNLGPFESFRWWRMLQEGSELLQTVGGEYNVLFESLLPKIAKDKGRSAELHDPGLAAELWEECSSSRAFSLKGPRLQTSRWQAVVTVARFWKQYWHQRLLVLQFIGITLGWKMKETGHDDGVGSTIPSGDAPKSSTSKKSPAVDEVRRKSTNTLHCALSIMSSPEHHRRMLLIESAGTPIERWHSEQVTRTKSPTGALDFYIANSLGSYMESLREVLSFSSSVEKLEGVGMVVELSPGLKSLTPDSAVVVAEDQFAAVVFRFCTALVSTRVKSMAWFHGLPGAFVVFLSEDTKAIDATLARLRALWESYAQLMAMPKTAFYRKLLDRSCFRLVVVRYMMELARQSGWQLTAAMKSLAHDIFLTVGQTKVIEDMFHFDRAANVSSSLPQVWATPIKSAVLEKVHNFKEVQWSQEVVPLKNRYLPTNLFQPRERAEPSVVPLKAVVGKQDWTSFSGLSSMILQADLHLLHFGYTTEQLCSIHHSWLCMLLRECTLVKNTYEARWWLSLGHMRGVVGLGWPVVIVHKHGERLMVPKPDARVDEVEPLVVLNLSDWLVQPIEIWSPVHVQLAGLSSSFCGVHAVLAGPPEGLLQHAAKHAFFDLPITPLKQLQAFLGLAPSETLWDVLSSLVTFAFPGLSELDLLAIMTKRMAGTQSNSLRLLENVDAQDIFGVKEGEAVEKLASEKKEQGAAMQTYIDRVRQLHQKLHKKPLRKPLKIPPGLHVGQPEAQKLMPPSSKIYRDTFNARWLATHSSWGQKSRSFQLYTERGALELVLQWAWAHHCAETGEPSPLAALTAAGAAAGAAASSSGA